MTNETRFGNGSLVQYTVASETDSGAGPEVYSARPRLEIEATLGDPQIVFPADIQEHLRQRRRIDLLDSKIDRLLAIGAHEIKSKLALECVMVLRIVNKVTLMWDLDKGNDMRDALTGH